MPALLFFLEKGVNPMTKLKKRATALLLGSVTFFMALAMPYNTTRVYAADVAFSWVVNESSNTILNWILLYLGISVAPEAISEGKVFDKTGQFAMDFCNEFFGDDVDTFKREFNKILTQDYSSVGDAVGSIPATVLNRLYSYLHSNDIYQSNLNGIEKGISVGESFNAASTGRFYYNNSSSSCETSQQFKLLSASSKVLCVGTIVKKSAKRIGWYYQFVSMGAFKYLFNGVEYVASKPFYNNGLYAAGGEGYDYAVDGYLDNFSLNMPYAVISASAFENTFKESIPNIFYWLLNGAYYIPDIDIPDVAGKDYAFDLVGWPSAWDIDKPDVKPWDGVDSLPIPGDVVLGDSIPGVIDFPDVIGKIIDGTIPWPDVIGAVRDIDIPVPDPDPDEPDKKPEPDPELPEIPAVLPQGVSDKLKDLSGKFPFCIPFDVVDCYKSFATKDNAEAPKWDIDFTIPGTNQEYHFSVDLAMFEKYIPIFRSGVLILFFIGLLLATRKLIGWQIDN